MKRTIRLRESELRNMISESVRRILREQEDMDSYVDDDGQTIHYDDEGWEYTEDDMGMPLPTGYMYDPEAGEEYQADYEGNRMFENRFRGKKKAVKRALKESYEPEATYIVFDGTTYYGIYGMDIEDEIADNDVEVVEGPFDDWDDEVDEKIEELNNEAQYGVNWRSHFTPGRY